MPPRTENPSAKMTNDMRGLAIFISDLRNCKIKGDEESRINKELTHIRAKFREPSINGYNKKKYVAKLLFLLIHGRDIDFGHLEGLSLAGSSKYSEKQMGYLAMTHFLPNHEILIPVVAKTMQSDMMVGGNDVIASCALHAITNIRNGEIYRLVRPDLVSLLTKGMSAGPFIQKKTLMCLLQVYRKDLTIIPLDSVVELVLRVLDASDLGVLQCAITLAIEMAQSNLDAFWPGYALVVSRLVEIAVEQKCSPAYRYYDICAPWLQVKLLRFLQVFPSAVAEGHLDELNNILGRILGKSLAANNAQQINAHNAIVLEAINLAVHIGVEEVVFTKACGKFKEYLLSKDPNYRYLGLESMARLIAYSSTSGAIQSLHNEVVGILHEKDPSILRRALDLLFNMCNETNCREIIHELTTFLSTLKDIEMKREVALRVAFMAEKFAREYTWYIDVTLELFRIAGDCMDDVLWYRIAKIVTNNDAFRAYTVAVLFSAIQTRPFLEKTVMLSAYLFGEFGHLIAHHSGCLPMDQFNTFHACFKEVSSRSKAVILSTFLKFSHHYPNLRPHIMGVLEDVKHLYDSEVQQRACEYLAILRFSESSEADGILAYLCEEMPVFPLEAGSSLLQKLQRSAPSSIMGSLEKVDVQAGLLPTLVPLYDASDLFRKLLVSSSGILYEDQILQIGLKFEHQNATQGRMYLFFGNKHPSTLNEIQMILSNPACNPLVDGGPDCGISINEQGGGIPSSIPSGEQIPVCWELSCCDIPNPSATGSIPTLNIRYRAESEMSLSILLPIVISKFLAPARLSLREFYDRWQQLSGGRGREDHFSTDLGRPGSGDSGQVSKLLEGFGFGVMEEENDKGPFFLLGSGILSFSSRTGKVGCLVRRVILTTESSWVVKTTNPKVTVEIVSLLVRALE